VQDKNIVLCVYKLDDAPGFLEQSVADFTHAYFPEDKLSDVKIDGRYAFARHRDTLLAFIGRYPLVYAEGSRDDLIQEGKDSYWIFEASTVADEGGIDGFRSRIRKNTVACKDWMLEYASGDDSLQVSFGGEFRLNDSVVNTEYRRFDSPYANCPRKPRTITISHDGHHLELDFYGRRRTSR
jgi:hypothetical protein